MSKHGPQKGHKKRPSSEMKRLRELIVAHIHTGQEIKAFGIEHGIARGQVYHFARDVGYRGRIISDEEYAHIQKRRESNKVVRP